MSWKTWKQWLVIAALLISVLGVVSAIAVRQRARRVEQIKNELRQLKEGMTVQEVRQSFGDWLERNEPIVRDYLLGLGPRDVGHPLLGARLTDGTQLFAGDVFLGAIEGIPEGVHGFSLQREDAKFACLWAGPSAPSLRLPRCTDRNALEHEVISRDVYTHGELQPGGRIVIVWCPSDDWLD